MAGIVPAATKGVPMFRFFRVFRAEYRLTFDCGASRVDCFLIGLRQARIQTRR